MSKGNTFENDLMLLIFNATPIANLADNAASSPLTSLYVSLHTADPGEAGTQTTSEISYTGYARVAVVRTSSGWTISTNTATNAAIVAFGACTAGSGTATYAAVGTASSGTGKLLYSGAITAPVSGLAISAGITPSFAIGAISVSED
jgi:hypothetical protein